MEQRNLLLIIQALMLIVIIPVYILTFVFSWRYRAQSKATYDPDLVDSTLAEVVWWSVPLVMTLIIGVLTWVKTHELDPFKPIDVQKKTLTIQVVAFNGNGSLFILKKKLPAVNFFQIPKDTPINFEITADAPMNSFWIPQLGGQIYAMPNMRTKLHLIANESGDFRGSSANISGEGFSGMHFIARASSEETAFKNGSNPQRIFKRLTFEEYQVIGSPELKQSC